MPSPSASLATLRPDIAGSLEEFDLVMDRQNFIGLQIMPVFEAAKPSGTFGKIPIEQLLKSRDTIRAPGSAYSRGRWTFTSDSFAAVEHGAEEPVDDNEAAIYADYFDAELVSAERARDAVLRNMEIRVASALFNTGTYTPTSVTNEWDDATNATPIDDIEARVQSIWDATGLWPNGLVISRKVFRNLRNCDQIISRIVAQGAGTPAKASDVTVQMLAAVFDLPYIFVGGGAKDSAAQGQATTVAEIWSSEYAAVGRFVPPGSMDIRYPGWGRTFHYGGDGSSVGTAFETYRDETVRGDIVRARHQVDEKIVYQECVELLDNITT